ncbi:hypothetical protein GF359_01060 [candidate division WOR-3 bacterium]|uniref:CDP-alcohol phosphatidyltransferase family protein n=1 Tax=candidate division WOR-3 bacterium TaxID=2052148 RepID=A0A9D5K7J4_UNCW3|nr:hypothetical protein [candidate division WOR-3 bacterium]MBD3363783.1 hypothetical protein [candidate division WOR-3 bacterium]
MTRNAQTSLPHSPESEDKPNKTTETDACQISPVEQEKNWRFLTVPNLLSILRLLLLTPTAWAILHKPPLNWLAFGLFVLSSATDALDGWIARRFNQKSEWGKILDPIADKLTLNVLAMIMALQERIPLFLALAVLGRDVIILAGGLFLLAKKTFVIQSNWAGKVTGVAFFAMLCAGLLNVRWLLDSFLVPVVTCLVLITLVTYSHSFLISLKERKQKVK